MLNHKKAQGISIRVIIIAAMALVVLFIILSIFSSRSSIFSRNVSSCESNGGRCVAADECDNPYRGLNCPENGEVCCLISGGFA